MPETRAVLYAEDDGSAPLLVWLDRQPTKVQDKCIVRIDRLKTLGYELRRPDADFLREGVYELRAHYGRVNFRILYFLQQTVAVLSHGLTKEDRVPDQDIELALSRKHKYESDPERHTYRE
jgi:phage-related protein